MRVVWSLIFCFISVFLGIATGTPVWAVDLNKGVSTETWTTWPQPDQWDQNQLINNFPEWRGVTSPRDIRALRQAGFDFVRLTVDPAMFLYNPSEAKTARLLASVNKGIASLQAAGLKVIVDLHSIPREAGLPGSESYLKDSAAFKDYLGLVATVGRSIATLDPAAVAFEPINEPTIDCPWDGGTNRWPAMARKLHATARAAAPKLAIVMQGACWGGAEGLTKLKPDIFGDTNIIWSFHSYEPMIFTHQGASWTTGLEQFVTGLAFPPRPTDRKAAIARAHIAIDASTLPVTRKRQLKREARERLTAYFSKGFAEAQMQKSVNQVARWAAKYKIPPSRILAGEFGAIRQDQGRTVPVAIRAAYLGKAANMFKAKGWAWSVWSWTGSFGIDERDGNRNPSPVLVRSLGMTPP